MRFNASGGNKVKIEVLGDPPPPPSGSRLDFVINGPFYGMGTPISSGTPTYALSQNFFHTGNPITQIAISVVKTSPAPTEPLILGLVPGSIVGTPAFFDLENWYHYGLLDQSTLPEFYTPYWVTLPTDLVMSGPICIAIITNQPDTKWFVSIIENGDPYQPLYRYCQNSEYCDDGWNNFSPYDIACAVYSYDWPCESYDTETECTQHDCYWWNNSCHDGLPTTCDELNNQNDCELWGCVWEGGVCRAPVCEDISNQSDCELVGCLWWNNSCHSANPTTCDELNNQNDCEIWGCYWYDGSCHSNPQQQNVWLEKAITTETDTWNCDPQVSGDCNCGDEGPKQTQFEMNEEVVAYALLESSGGFDFYGHTVKQEWWYNTGSGLEKKSENEWTIQNHWVGVCVWTWWMIGALGSGVGVNKIFLDDVYIGSTNTYEVVAPPCSYWSGKNICEDYGCWWWNGSCHEDQPTSCEQINSETDCSRWGCYWYDGACHSECWWWNGECHAGPPESCSELNNQPDCEGVGCFWYNNTCHSIPLPGICEWLIDKENPANINITNVFEIIDSYISSTPVSGYDFIPIIPQVFGVIDYYLGFNGDTKTGCPFTLTCEERTTQLECELYGCHWYNDNCHTNPPDCEQLNNQTDCSNYECYWYDGACHSTEPSCEQLTNQTDCSTYGCYWYDGACHSEYQELVLTLIPNANGVEPSSIDPPWTWWYKNTSAPHYQHIDDPVGSPDEDSTFVEANMYYGGCNFYALPNHTTETGVIDKLVFHFRARKYPEDTHWIAFWVGPFDVSESHRWGWQTQGVDLTSASYQNYSRTVYDKDGSPITWDDIDDMQIYIWNCGDQAARLTQLYVDVYYHHT